MSSNIWLIGTGQMAVDYANVLKNIGIPFTVIGRGEAKCAEFESKTGLKPVGGGINNYLGTNPPIPGKVIVAVNVEELSAISKLLIAFGVREILLEKPGVAYAGEIDELAALARVSSTTLLIAYNRRFYASVLAAEKIIGEDGGVSSFSFEFTEWSHIISRFEKTKADLNNWFLGNSTHVIDLAFYLGGAPEELSAYYKGSLDWHPSSSVFSGAGISAKGALFCYHANWEAPGRWVVEFLTKQHRLIFKPMEQLQVQKMGSVVAEPVNIDDSLDKQFKPGLYRQTQAFLAGDYNRFCDVYGQQEMINNVYRKMSGY